MSMMRVSPHNALATRLIASWAVRFDDNHTTRLEVASKIGSKISFSAPEPRDPV